MYRKCNKCKKSCMKKCFAVCEMPCDWDSGCEKMDPCKMDSDKMDSCKKPMKCPSKAQLTRMIQETQFACIELNLFLDTHQNDPRALRDFNSCSKQLMELIEMYECNYGPLFNFGLSQNRGRWQWIDPLWPWQI